MPNTNRIRNFATACWNGITCSNRLPSTSDDNENDNAANNNNNNNNNENGGGNNGENDPLIWSIDLERHSCGEFSYAVVQVDDELRTYSQVDVGSNAIFVGIYDGRAGPHASKFISKNLMTHLIANIRNHNTVVEETVENAVLTTDERFLSHVRRARRILPSIVINGSSCLVGIIWRGKIFIAQVGNSRAMCCRTHPYEERFLALQMTLEHNINYFWVRQGVLDSHSDPNLLVRDDSGLWKIKGVTELSRSIGDAYLKKRNMIVDPSLTEFQLSSPLIEPAVSAVPMLNSRPIEDSDRFFIFGNHEFWSLMTNDKAMEIINTNPRNGIARKLINTAQQEACRIADMDYNELSSIPKGPRKGIHDDMSVVVVFVDLALVGVKDTNLEQRSFKGFTDEVAESQFRIIDQLM